MPGEEGRQTRGPAHHEAPPHEPPLHEALGTRPLTSWAPHVKQIIQNFRGTRKLEAFSEGHAKTTGVNNRPSPVGVCQTNLVGTTWHLLSAKSVSPERRAQWHLLNVGGTYLAHVLVRQTSVSFRPWRVAL